MEVLREDLSYSCVGLGERMGLELTIRTGDDPSAGRGRC